MKRLLTNLPLLLGIACLALVGVQAKAGLPTLRASCASVIGPQFQAAPGAGVLVAVRCDKTSYQVLESGTAFRVGDRTWMSAEHVANANKERDFSFTASGEPVAAKGSGDIHLYLIDEHSRAHEVRSWRSAATHDVVVLDVSSPGTKRTLRAAQEGEAVTAIGPGPSRTKHLTMRSELPDPLGKWSGSYMQLDGAVEHGYSGGPILDRAGNVVGMNYAIDGAKTRTYAVPAQALSDALHP